MNYTVLSVSDANPNDMSFLPTDHFIISRSQVDDEFKMINSDDKHSDKRSGNVCIQLSPPLPPLSSQTPEFYAVVKLGIFKKISTSMLAPVTVDTAYFLLDFKSSLCLDKFKDQLFEVFVSTNGDYESQNKLVHIHIMLPERGILVHKSMSPCWLSSHSTICAQVDLMGDILGMNVLPQEHTGKIVSCTSPLDACGKLSIMSRSFWSDAKFDNVWERFLSAELISHQAVSDQWMFYDPCKNIDSDTLLAFPTKKYFWLDKLNRNKCFDILSLPLSSQIAEFYAVVKLEIFKKISTSMLAPFTVDTAYFLIDFKSSLCLDKFKDQLFEVFVSTNGDYESPNKIVHVHIMLPERGTLVHKSMSPCWLSSHSTICAQVDLMGDILGMNVLPQEHTGEIVSCTSPLDACGKLSIMSRSFWSDAKFDNVWERFLSAELFSHQAVSDQWMFYDPCKNIDSDTLLAFPTKKYFWLDKLNRNKCFDILSLPLSTVIYKSLSPCWPLSRNTIHPYVDVRGGVSGLNAFPQDLIEEIVSRTSPVDACGNLSIVSKSFQSAAKSDHVWHRFLPADLISRRAKSNESHYMMYAEDPWKKIDSDTLKAFPTKKDLYLFLSDNALIIDDGDMYFWLDKLSGKKCFYLVPEKLSIPEPDGWHGDYSYFQLTLPFKIEGKISTSLLSSNTTYTAYLWFDFTSSLDFSGFGEEEPLQTFVGIDGGCESESRIVYIPFMPSKYSRKKLISRPPDMPILSGPQYPRRRDDDMYELELGDYFNKEGGGDDNRELKMCLSEVKTGEPKGGIYLHGILIRPKNCQKNHS